MILLAHIGSVYWVCSLCHTLLGDRKTVTSNISWALFYVPKHAQDFQGILLWDTDPVSEEGEDEAEEEERVCAL